MILWTIQKEEAWEQLKKQGYITGTTEHIEKSFIPSYRWIVNQMKKRLGNLPHEENALPIWAWYQWGNSEKSRPDLRFGGHLPRNERGVRIEFNCPENKALLSDFVLWHYVLNYWYLPESSAADEGFEIELQEQALSFFETKPLPHTEYHKKIVKSWNKIFNLDWSDPDLALPKDQKSIQATVWQLEIAQVRSYTYFKSR